MEDDLIPSVLMFIGRFSYGVSEPRKEVYECFLFGCCWWFAYILSVRFAENNPSIMIAYSNHHVGCKIGDDVYDITGIVTDKYVWEKWDDCTDASLRQRITDHCIMF